MSREIQLDFFSDIAQARASGRSKSVRRSRIIRLRSAEAEALAPAIDSDWFEMVPLHCYEDVLP